MILAGRPWTYFASSSYISDAKWSNHLHFNLSLKRFQIFPVSLSISSAVKGPRAEKILFKAKRNLLTERTRQTHISIKNIRKDRQEAESEIATIVGAAVFEECVTRFRSAFRHHFNKTRDKQKNKLSRLIAEHKQASQHKHKQLKFITKEKEAEVKKKWILNTLSKTLTQSHLNVLTKGLAFTPTPKNLRLLTLSLPSNPVHANLVFILMPHLLFAPQLRVLSTIRQLCHPTSRQKSAKQ